MREKSYVELNNEVLVEGQFNADKDKEAVKKIYGEVLEMYTPIENER